jgi:DnaK suppressor protein
MKKTRGRVVSQYEPLAAELRRQRQAIFAEVADLERDLADMAGERESELEEHAQEERAARVADRLALRGKREIEEIDAALERIAAGTFGSCQGCGNAIPMNRLQALPAARFCLDCARQQEARAQAGEPSDVERHQDLPADLGLLSDRDAEASLLELVRGDGRVDMDELRLVYRHGIVHLDGAIPSESEHRILLELMTDVAGVPEVVDRLRVSEILWERPERSKAELPREEFAEEGPSAATDDIVRSGEEGLDYTPPFGPTPEEEQ